MGNPSLAPHPVAEQLLSRAREKASGTIALADRQVTLAEGRCVSVQGNDTDEPLDAFILRSGRLDEATLAQVRAEAAAGPRGLIEQLQLGDLLSDRELRSLRRSLYLDRLVRAMRALPDAIAPLPWTPDTPQRQAPPGFGLTELLLDALSRIAADGAAGAVGSQMRRVLHFIDAPELDEARQWAALTELPDPPTVAAVVSRHPTAVPRIAALVMAGFAQLRLPSQVPERSDRRVPSVSGGTLPPPAPRLQLMPAEAPHASDSQPPPSSEASLPPGAEGGRATVLPPRVVLTPGETTEWLNLTIDENHPRFERQPASLSDPLRVIELYIDSLEHEAGSAAQRAAAFVELAELWMTRIGCLEEATRAMREAAVADPTDVGVLVQTAAYCQAMGDGPLAIAYLQAACDASPSALERVPLLCRLSWAQLACGNHDEAIAALREAAALDTGLPEPHERLAALSQDRREASLHALSAAGLRAAETPDRALALLAEAHVRDPSLPAATTAYATALADAGTVEGGCALLLGAARHTGDVDTRRGLLMDGARRAEEAGLPHLAAELLLDAHDAEPQFELVYSPLHEDLAACGDPHTHAAVLQDIALHCAPAEGATWLECAAEAMRLVDDEAEHTRLLFQQLLAIAPDNPAALDYLGSDAPHDPPDLDAIAAGLDKRLAQVDSDREERALLRQLTGLHHARGDARSTVSHCLRYLALDPDDPMVVARLWRATAALQDMVLTREALGHRVRVAAEGPARTRALCRLSHHLETMGELAEAVSTADAALVGAPSAADAAEIVLRHAKHLSPARGELLLQRVCPLLGESRRLLAALARAALDTQDEAGCARVLQRWMEVFPYDPVPRAELLVAALATEDTRRIFDAARTLVACAGGPVDASLAKRAVECLLTLGSAGLAAELTLTVLGTLGMRDPELATTALDAAKLSGDRQLVARAMDAVAIAASAETKAAALLDLATHHARVGDTLAELRTYIRLLGVEPAHAEALSRLQTLFSEGGDYQRLLIVRTVAQQTADDPETRRRNWLQLAAMAAQLLLDETRCDEYLVALMREGGGDHGWIGRGLGLLFGRLDPQTAVERGRAIAEQLEPHVAAPVLLVLCHATQRRLGDPRLAAELAADGIERDPTSTELLLTIEQLALDLDDLDLGLRTYAAMQDAAVGNHSKRSLHYRAGRWLERAGHPSLGLREYAAAFKLAPGLGVALRAIERLAPQQQDWDLLISTYEELVPRLGEPKMQQQLLQRAGEMALTELDDPARAFDFLRAAMPDDGSLDRRTREAAELLAERAPEAGQEALTEIAQDWEARLEKLWDGPARVHCLLSLAELHMQARDDVTAALAKLDEALRTVEEQSLDPDVRVAVLCAQGEALRRLGKVEEARAVLRAVESVRPDSTAALQLAERLGHSAPASDATGAALEAKADPTLGPDTADAAEPPAAHPHSGHPALAAARIPSELQAPSPGNGGPRAVAAPMRRRAPTESFKPIPMPPRPPAVAAPLPSPQPRPEATAAPTPTALDGPAPSPQTDATHMEVDAGAADGVITPVAPPFDDEPRVQTVVTPNEHPSFFPEPPEPPDAIAVPSTAPAVTPGTLGPDDLTPLPSPLPSAPAGPPPTPAAALRRRGITLPGGGDGRAPAPRRSATGTTTPGMEAPRPADAALRAQAAAGDVDARVRLASTLVARPECRVEARQLLANAVQSAPGRTDAIRLLHETARSLGAAAETIVTGQLLSLFDDSVLPARNGALPPSLFKSGEVARAIGGLAAAESQEMLALLWESTRAIPHVRRHLSTYGVTDMQRVSASATGPIPETYAHAVMLLGRRFRPALYLRPADAHEITVTATQPPAVVISTGMGDLPEMPIHLARAVVLAAPEHAVFSTLDEHDARALLAGCVVAFGPRDAADASDPDAMRMAGALWDATPKRIQHRLGELLATRHAELAYDDLKHAVLQAAACAALFVSADVRLTLRTLAGASPALHATDIGTAEGFTTACERSDEFADVVRAALSDQYLAAIARVSAA